MNDALLVGQLAGEERNFFAGSGQVFLAILRARMGLVLCLGGCAALVAFYRLPVAGTGLVEIFGLDGTSGMAKTIEV